MSIQKINKEGISDQVFAQMKRQILEGEWKPGDKLPSENELARQFGVSRVTVRNALQKLAALNLVETRFGEGSFVREPDAAVMLRPLVSAAYLGENTLEEILQFRKMIEGPVCGEACRRATDAEITRLRALFHRMEDARNDLPRFADCDYQFHMRLAELAGNSLILQMYSIVNEVLRSSFDQIVQARGNQAGLLYHRQITEAFERRDSESAEAVMKEHMEDLNRFYKGKLS